MEGYFVTFLTGETETPPGESEWYENKWIEARNMYTTPEGTCFACSVNIEHFAGEHATLSRLNGISRLDLLSKST